jgi:hypothetical protein
MVPLKIESLYNTLIKKGVQAEMQQETGQIFFGFKSHEESFAIFMRIYEQSQLLQIIVFLPCQYEEKTAGDVARVLHWINQAIDLPGFGMEEGGKTLFYRLMLPALGMQLDDKLLEPFLGAIRSVCETFYPSIKAVASGEVTFDQVRAKMAEGQE